MPNEGQSQAIEQASSFTIPDEYKDRGWASKIQSADDLFKSYDNAQTLIGKRPAGIPTKDASDAEWDAFYKAAGRPDEPIYEFSDPEGLPEDMDLSDFKAKASELFHKAGLNQRQAQALLNNYLELELQASSTQTEAQRAEQEAKDAEFDKLVTEQFGDNYEAELNKTVAAFERHAPQSLRDSLNDIIVDNPRALAGLVAAVNGIQREADEVKQKYGVDAGKLATGAQATPQSTDDIRTELAQLRISAANKDFTHPEHKQTRQRVEELSAALNRQLKS